MASISRGFLSMFSTDKADDHHKENRADNGPDHREGIPAKLNRKEFRPPQLNTHPGAQQSADESDNYRYQTPSGAVTNNRLCQ